MSFENVNTSKLFPLYKYPRVPYPETIEYGIQHCPKCKCSVFKVIWEDAGGPGTGGTLTLFCVSCGYSWVVFDDCA